MANNHEIDRRNRYENDRDNTCKSNYENSHETDRLVKSLNLQSHSDICEILGEQFTTSETFTNDRSDLARHFTMAVFSGSNRTDLAYQWTSLNFRTSR